MSTDLATALLFYLDEGGELSQFGSLIVGLDM